MKTLLIISFALLCSCFASSQTTGPEQDCIGAIRLCQEVFVQNDSYVGIGDINDINGNSMCLQNDENNSVWYMFDVAVSGIIEFSIIPVNATDDYDFTIYNLTGASCSDIVNGTAPEVRCNYAFTNGPTGIQTGYVSHQAGPGDSAFVAPINAAAGETYALLVDNFSSTNFGYTLDFSASTVIFGDSLGPKLRSVRNISCLNDSSVEVRMSQRVICSSIATDGSDFDIYGPNAVSVNNAYPINCNGNGRSDRILLKYTGNLPEGNQYYLRTKVGTDGNTFYGLCGITTPDTMSFIAQDTLITVSADFQYSSFAKELFVYDNSANAISWRWDMGDGRIYNGIANFFHTYSQPGIYNVCLIARGYCDSASVCKLVSIESNEIDGKVYIDRDKNCLRDSNDISLIGEIIKVTPGPYFTMTNYLGEYEAQLGVGNYNVQLLHNPQRSWLLGSKCPGPGGYAINFTTPYQDTSGLDFADTALSCSYLTVEVTSGRRRICNASHTNITYCNEGLEPATNVVVRVVYPPHITYNSSTYPGLPTITPTEVVFNIGDLDPLECGTIVTTDEVDCNAPGAVLTGITQCFEAYISPENDCQPISPLWSQADLIVEGVCLNSNLAEVTIINQGIGDMVDSTEFRIFLDSSLVHTQNLKLNAGDSLLLQLPPHGQTLRVEVDQVEYHPTNSMISYTLEGCGRRTISLGFVTQFPPNDYGEQHSTDCSILWTSYDPNDKNVVPTGVSQNHYILPGTRLDYKINFQNTGNDTAYKVVILDTISPKFDLSTLEIGAASHPYTVELGGYVYPVLLFKFDDIYLPDSTTDYDNSHGFISYSVKPIDTLPIGTHLENRAYIFFDQNPPVKTNTVSHIISNRKFISSEEVDSLEVSYAPFVSGLNQLQLNWNIRLYPNPATDQLYIEMDKRGQHFELEIVDVFGKRVLYEQFNRSTKVIDLSGIRKGIYFLRISNDVVSKTEKVIVVR